MVKLSVNLNKIAVIRNSRGGDLPSVLKAARTSIAAGCHGITVHPRPDGRHIRRQDVFDLSALLTQEYKRIEFNIEGYPGAEFLELIHEVRPTQCTLVPDPPGVLTSNAGWKLDDSAEWLREVLAKMRSESIRTSLFVEPNAETIERAKELGADRIELYTGPYAAAFDTPERDAVLGAHRDAAKLARRIGLGVNAGHDLDLRNLPLYVKTVKGLQETSIGHALISDAIYTGLARAVKAYLKALGSKPLAVYASDSRA
ncbi:MAG TPA: pyridoxine 5'-phosphate synthase [Candidatus Binataceae bacterium]|nr:pyridoxine 5'-phosphate synthase [Candidatus Binataceae bacterium]